MKILLIGCGKMGSAMLNGWIGSGMKPAAVTIVDPEVKLQGRVAVYKNMAKLSKGYYPDIIVLAVKPQSLKEVLPALAKFKHSLIISIIAGKTIAAIQKAVPDALIVRTMPNLPAIIGKGVIAAVAGRRMSLQVKTAVTRMLQPCGKVIWFNDEKLIDSVTAISGSGPAYVFLFAQSLVEAAVALGIDAKTAKILALETIRGSTLLAEASPLELDKLKVNVTSKGGTTEAALKIFEHSNALKNLVKKATAAAKKRASELSK